jgi:hypothetical protein
MRRIILSSAAVGALCALLFACEKPGQTERQKMDQASSAAQGNPENQAAANRETVNAQEEFAKTREDYLHGRRIDLINLDERVFDLETEAQTATGKTKTDLSAHLPEIRAQRRDFARHMRAMNDESGPAWDTAKANLDKEWEHLKSAVDDAK